MDVSIGKSKRGFSPPIPPVPCGAWIVIGVSALPGERYMDAEKLLWGFAIALVLCGVVFAVLW